MGFNDQEIVALSGAHTLGRARPTRSGFGKESTKYTVNGPGKPGGESWTPDWLVFDNSYFKVSTSDVWKSEFCVCVLHSRGPMLVSLGLLHWQAFQCRDLIELHFNATDLKNLTL